MDLYESYSDIKNRLFIFEQDNYTHMPHFHKSIEMQIVTAGELTVTIGIKKITLKKGEILFIPPYYPHSLSGSSEQTKNTVIIIPERYYKDIAERHDLNFFILDNKEINGKILDVVQAMQVYLTDTDGDSLIIDGLVRVLFGLIIANYTSSNTQKRELDLIQKIIDYLNMHFTEHITISQAAAEFGFSKNYFSKIFNEYFGCNFTTYINRLRIRYINQNMNSSDKNLIDVVMDSGFGSVSAYYAFLKRTT
ncbi:MAG: helix-turn-helix transcriptional regulator [Clostridiales bacterium]|nr:helix-turn-helix transcriptional regulator [Clostridiales bacterium]